MLYFWKALGTRTTVALLPDVTHTNTGRQRQIQERKQRNFEIGQVCPYTLDGASWISSGPSIGPYCPYILKMIAVFLNSLHKRGTGLPPTPTPNQIGLINSTVEVGDLIIIWNIAINSISSFKIVQYQGNCQDCGVFQLIIPSSGKTFDIKVSWENSTPLSKAVNFVTKCEMNLVVPQFVYNV